MSKFNTKGIYMTNGIKIDLDQNKIRLADIQSCIERHFENDGDECKEDKKANEEAIKNNDGRVFSVFHIHGAKIYIITDGLNLANDPEHGTTYPMTTILFPEEY